VIHLWRWLESQDVPGMWLGAASPLAGLSWLIHRGINRRHKERLAAQHALTAALTRQKD